MTQDYANIHSIETMGTVDGPGVRFVVFFQGCPLRCLYCHNPDTWDNTIKKKMSVDGILNKFDKVKEFLRSGGLTVTGGEPLLQIDFLVQLFKKCKEKNIHTALDTSGILFNKNDTKKIDELIKYTNLVLLDIKHIDSEIHHKLTGQKNENVLDFARYLSKNNVPVWIRHVLVPGITLNKSQLVRLGEFLSTLDNIEALDLLPYHNMAIKKYEALNKEYHLKDTPIPTTKEIEDARTLILDTMRATKPL